MYGWMTLHLKGEGQGNPIPEPALQTEDPEVLRCWPGDTRPEEFMSIPRFAAREAERQIADHRQAWPTHLPMWQTHALQTRHTLGMGVLGGGALIERKLSLVSGPREEQGLWTAVYRSEPGVEITLITREGGAGKGRYLILDLEGATHARESALVRGLESRGATVCCVDLRATGRYAIPGDTIGRAPDHNSAEWSVWTGRPLLGQWIVDGLAAVEAQRAAGGESETTVVGLGAASLVALGVGIFDSRVDRVVGVGGLASFRSETPYVGQWMGLFAPGILRDAGDIPHLAALIAPRKLVIAGGVRGDSQPLPLDDLRAAYADTQSIFRLHGREGHLTILSGTEGEELAGRLI